EIVVFRGDLPRAPAIQVFAHDHGCRRLLAIAHADFEALIDDLAAAVHAEAGLPALADHIEGIAELDAHRLVARRVPADVLTDELQGAVDRGLVDAHATGRQRHAELVGLLVVEFEIGANRSLAGRAIALVGDRL